MQYCICLSAVNLGAGFFSEGCQNFFRRIVSLIQPVFRSPAPLMSLTGTLGQKNTGLVPAVISHRHSPQFFASDVYFSSRWSGH
jgi:hypothetical protein